MSEKTCIANANMWHMLTRTVTENIDSFHLDKILVMISNNLTFDDPGLFSKNLLSNCEEKLYEETANIWLINQLFYSLSISNNNRTVPNNLALQKDIISASLLKQPWFFKIIIQEYTKITHKLVDINFEDEKCPIELEVFYGNSIYITKLDPDAVFRKIKLLKVEKKDVLLENNIKILTHAVGIGFDLYDELFEKVTECVLAVFNHGIFRIKRFCLEYITKIVSQANEITAHVTAMIDTFTLDIQVIIEKLLQWVEFEGFQESELVEFNKRLVKYLQMLTLLKFPVSALKTQEKHVKMWAEILCTVYSKKYKKFNLLFQDLDTTIVKFILNSLKGKKNISYKHQLYKLINNIEFAPEIIRILEVLIFDEITEQNLTSNVFQKCKKWEDLYALLLHSFELINNNEPLVAEELSKNLKIISEIFKCISNIEHNYQVWHQMEHIKQNPCKICSNTKNQTNKTFIDGSIIEIINLELLKNPEDLSKQIDYFINKLMDIKKIGMQDFCYIVEIAGTLLQSRICSYFNTNLHIHLIEFVSQSLRNKFELSLKTVPLQIEELFPEFEVNFQTKCFSLIMNIEAEHLSLESRCYLKDLIEQLITNQSNAKDFLHDNLFNLMINKILPFSTIKRCVITPALHLSPKPNFLWENIKNLVCSLYGNVYIFKNREDFSSKYKVICKDCDIQKTCLCSDKDSEKEFYKCLIKENRGIFIPVKKNTSMIEFKKEFSCIFDSLLEEDVSAIKAIPSLINHLDLLEDAEIQNKWIQLFGHNSLHIRLAFSNQLPQIVKLFLGKPTEVRDPALEKCIRALLISVRDCLNESNKDLQTYTVSIILKFGTIDGIPENILLHLFKMTFMFFIRYESCVADKAALCAAEICSRNGVSPKKMLNWYKQDILKLIIALSVSIFLRNGIELKRSLNNITKMLGFIGPRDFINKHYKLIVAILLPWCIKQPKCSDLLEEVASIVQKNIPTVLTSSFLTSYPYLFLNETTEINNKCIDFVIDNTGSSLYNLLHSDIKRTVAEILIYYHKNPENVMKAFRCLLPKDVIGTQRSGEIPHGKLAEYISTRFLGVLTYFEACLIDPDFEKGLKLETMLSLGEIMRFIGSKHITPFRFKILAMLRTALTVDDVDLKRVCAKVWNIFIHTVDVQALGPLLSTIVASLEPLLKSNPEEVNSICKFLVLSNGSLLSMHIPDLYFIENFPVSDDLKKFVSQQTEKLWKGDNFIEKFKFFLIQTKHENLAVRTYGLKYLTKLFLLNRQNLNKLVTGRSSMDPILEKVLDNLMICCRHIDKNLQIAAGQCLGEIGAVEPSHLPPNYAPQREFAMDIHTDAFAIMALEELCRAYQFQKDTKYVDSFSLAIQEILAARGVCPKKKKKMDVWEAIPERMRQLMEPLLTSCYTGLTMNSHVKVHPVFGSAKCQTYEEWAFIWASNMIENVRDEDTQHLLKSFKPSIKRDTNTLALFLPYIVLHALQSSDNENIEKIYEELQSVFEAAINKDGNIGVNKPSNRGLKTLQFEPSTHGNKPDKLTEYIDIKCAKVGFEQLDFLERWLREWRLTYIGHTPDSQYLKVESFVRRFDTRLMAKSNFNCGEFARALKYIEAYIESVPKVRLQESLSFLAEIYTELMDPDSLEGAIGLKKTDLTLYDQILLNNMTDRLLESTACFEKLMQSEEILPNHVKDIVQCYLRLDTPETALLISEGLFNRLGEKYMNDCLKETQAEPLWRLGRFDELEKLLENRAVNESFNWGVQCGQALLSFRKSDGNFHSQIENIRLNVLKILRTGGNEQNPYYKSYPQIMKLHFISEIEKTKMLVTQITKRNSEREYVAALNKLFVDWNFRLDLLQPTPRFTEPVLSLRRILLNEMKELLKQSHADPPMLNTLSKMLDDEIGKMWIRSSELMRKAGWYQQAQLCIMNAEEYKPNDLFLEKAKLFWKKGDQTHSLKVIEQKIKEIEEIAGGLSSPSTLPQDTRHLYAEAKFLQATYNAESMNISSDLNIHLFKESLSGNSKSEKCLVQLAQYIDRVYVSLSEEEQQNTHGRQMLIDVMGYYGKSMFFGCEFIYQSMPRLLSIWFDFSAQMKRDDHFRKVVHKMNEIVEKFTETLPLFIFFTAFSQLISRICHPSSEVYNVFKTIIVRLILKFPQQSLWMLLSVYKSSYPNRRKRCTEIFQDRRLNNLEMQTLISDFNSLAEKLIELTNNEIPSSVKNPTVSSLVRGLPKLFADPNFSKIVMPFQQFMQPTLPPIDERSSPAHSFNSFPYKNIYIKGIKEEISILASLQKPRKVVLIGSNGKQYTVMMKPKDDLRKDFRLMEFNAVVKQYLHQDPDARQRRLGIRTYAVLPLNEECGLIEWVENLHAFRQILLGFYKRRNQGMNAKELRSVACSSRDPIEKKRNLFLNTLIPRHPPVFAEWFKQSFTTPHNWYQARSSYIRTTAVMSVVGYILGLGDRHGENILFDGTNGDTVHVDFNCLFNKGETFDYPEKVPFRLTHNMVHAMGPLGVEGLYRKCCEITMRVLQAQTPTLMSVLRPFVYDPLVSWTRHYKTDGQTERTDPQAMVNVKHIEERLKGFIKIKGRTSNMPLSTEGQVNFIISEATDIDNLAGMYIGWGAFM